MFYLIILMNSQFGLLGSIRPCCSAFFSACLARLSSRCFFILSTSLTTFEHRRAERNDISLPSTKIMQISLQNMSGNFSDDFSQISGPNTHIQNLLRFKFSQYILIRINLKIYFNSFR